MTADAFREHWQYFRSADAIPTRGGPNTSASNKLGELFVGAAVAQFANDVRAAEPDITCEFEGTRWGIACKTFHSANPRTHLARLIEGAMQLEKADVQHGIVAVNLANLVPQALLLRMRTDWDFSHGRDPVLDMVSDFGRRIVNKIPEDELVRGLSLGTSRPRDRTRAVQAFYPALIPVHGRAMLACATVLHEFRRVQHPMEVRFARAFNDALERAV